MGRELRRKEERKNKNNNKVVETENTIKGSTIIKLAIAIIIIIVALYYSIAIFITKEIKISLFNDTNTEEQSSTEVTNKILATNIFNQKEETYYVYFYDFTDEDTMLSSSMSNIETPVYRVDTSSGLNKKYVTEENGNRNVASVSDLKVKSPTLIKITSDKVSGYYEGRIEILNAFK